MKIPIPKKDQASIRKNMESWHNNLNTSNFQNKNKLRKEIPKFVLLIGSLAPSSIIIGGFAKPFFPNSLEDISEYGDRDIDIVIDPAEWHKVAPYIPKDAKPNTYGGWKFEIESSAFDMWPESIAHILTSGRVEYMYNIRHDLLYGKK